MKRCIKCQEIKEIGYFPLDKKCNSGYSNRCMECRKKYLKEYNLKNPGVAKRAQKKYRDKNLDKCREKSRLYVEKTNYNKIWYENNKERKLDSDKIWYENNKERKSASSKKWQEENKEQFKEWRNNWTKEKRKNDYLFRLKENLKSSIRKSITERKFRKNTSSVNILGCSFNELRNYIESKFESWMTWENYGLYNGELNYGWDIDHIIPLSSAKTEEGIVKLNHYTNLQPLCSKVNRDIKRNYNDGNYKT
jgi:hypothetical protein